MSDWTRNIALEDAFEEMHGIRPQVFYMRLSKESYKIRLVNGDITVELQEVMDKGLTEDVTLFHNGLSKGYKNYHAAELEAATILRS